MINNYSRSLPRVHLRVDVATRLTTSWIRLANLAGARPSYSSIRPRKRGHDLGRIKAE